MGRSGTLPWSRKGRKLPDAWCELCPAKLSDYRDPKARVCMPCERTLGRVGGKLPEGFVVNDYQKRVMGELGPEGWVVEETRSGSKLVALHEKTGCRVMIHATPSVPSTSMKKKLSEARRRVWLAQSHAGRFVEHLRKVHKVPADGFVELRMSVEAEARKWLLSQTDSHLMPSSSTLRETLSKSPPGVFEVVKSHGRGGSDVKIFGKLYVVEDGAATPATVSATDASRASAARLKKTALETAGVDQCGRVCETGDGLAVCDDVANHVGMHTDTMRKFAWRDCMVEDSEHDDSVCNLPAGHAGSHHDRARNRSWIDVPVERKVTDGMEVYKGQKKAAPLEELTCGAEWTSRPAGAMEDVTFRCNRPAGHAGVHMADGVKQKPLAPPKPADALESVTPPPIRVEVTQKPDDHPLGPHVGSRPATPQEREEHGVEVVHGEPQTLPPRVPVEEMRERELAARSNGAAPGLPAELVEQIRAALFVEERERMESAEEHAEFMRGQLAEYRARVAALHQQAGSLLDDLDGAMELLGVSAEAEPVESEPRGDAAAVR